APAHGEARAMGRNGRECPVHRLDVEPGHRAELVETQVGELDVPPHPEIRAVELEDEARPRHRLVLGPHRLGDREQVRLVARVVVVVEEQRDHARRRGRDEPVLGLRGVARGAQVLGVDRRGARVTDADRPVAGRRPATRPPGIPGDALLVWLTRSLAQLAKSMSTYLLVGARGTAGREGPAAPSRFRNFLSRRFALAGGSGLSEIGRAEIETVREVIRPYVRVTPVV